jgi:hypothetical protein
MKEKRKEMGKACGVRTRKQTQEGKEKNKGEY